MKLVRLTQNPPVSKTNDFCIFNSNFQVNLNLEPNSQVALQSLSFQLLDEGLIITPDNTPIVVSITNDGVDLQYIMYLPSRSYSETEYQQFFNDFMFALNKGLTFISNYLGTEWRVSLDESNKFLVIEFGRGLIGIEGIQLENVDQTGTIFEPSKAPAQNDVFLYFRKRLCRGVGYLRFRNSAADASDELFAGFTINPLNDSSATIDRSLIKYGIGISKLPHVYYYIIDGVKTNVVDIPAVSDILEIRINFGDLQIGYYRFNTGVFNVIHQVDDVFESGSNKILYPVIALQREDCQITDVSFTETPYEDGKYAKTSELLQEMEIEKPKPKKKERKKMSDEAKEALLERLKKGRAKAKANREAKKKERLEEKSETLKELKEIKEDINNFKSKMETKNEKKNNNNNSIDKVNNNDVKLTEKNKTVPTLPKIKTTFHGYNPNWWDK